MTDYSDAAQRERLEALFPRGRFVRAEDGQPLLVARARRYAGCHLYEQAPGRVLGLYYVGSPRPWIRVAGDLVERHQRGDGEGVLHLTWCVEAVKRLRMFSRGRGGVIRNLRPPTAPGFRT